MRKAIHASEDRDAALKKAEDVAAKLEGMKLKKAYMLDFSRNAFFGTIPSDIEHENYSTLRLLYMDHNLLKGTIPASLMQMRKMMTIHLMMKIMRCEEVTISAEY